MGLQTRFGKYYNWYPRDRISTWTYFRKHKINFCYWDNNIINTSISRQRLSLANLNQKEKKCNWDNNSITNSRTTYLLGLYIYIRLCRSFTPIDLFDVKPSACSTFINLPKSADLLITLLTKFLLLINVSGSLLFGSKN